MDETSKGRYLAMLVFFPDIDDVFPYRYRSMTVPFWMKTPRWLPVFLIKRGGSSVALLGKPPAK
jgi:hypothetical protein